MDTRAPAVEAHYTQKDLQASIWAALRQTGRSPDALTLDDLAPVDGYHIRGREATRELLDELALDETTRVLDVGCGIGGTCRFVAATYGSRATGVDLSAAYCEVATLLTQRVGLADAVRFLHGDALQLPVADGSFDVAISEHVQMNIADKQAYVREIARVLRPGGTCALYEICAGEKAPPHYPVPWADDASISFLTAPDALRTMLEKAGMDVVRWEDVTAKSLAWFEETLAKIEEQGPPPLGLHLLMGKDAKTKMQNVARNLAEDRIAVVTAVARKA